MKYRPWSSLLLVLSEHWRLNLCLKIKKHTQANTRSSAPEPELLSAILTWVDAHVRMAGR
jgi:hypothetical protein